MALPRIQAACRALHRWIGIALAVLLVPVSLTGAALVWYDHWDAMVSPGRYAVTGASVAHPISDYLANAKPALPEGLQPLAVRFPAEDGWPLQVMARGVPLGEFGPPRILNVYLDPPTGRVLDVVDFRSSLAGWLHRFHGNLTMPEYSGRAIVGWIGVGMLILSLSGIWLWWPRRGGVRPGFQWRRAAQTSSNLHHLMGFWVSVPLAVVSLTGVYLSFPQNARSLMSSVAPMNPPLARPGFGPLARDVRLTPDGALAAALTAHPGTRPVAIFLPTAGANAARGRAPGEAAKAATNTAPLWRVQLREPDAGDLVTLNINDRTGDVMRMPAPLAGDRAALWIRRIHDGGRGGPVWRVLVFLTGILPALFAATGIMIWLRGRHLRRVRVAAIAKLQAAE
jgi:uncharacterized iron-regulated membrane protein